jgi:hypothetical protein
MTSVILNIVCSAVVATVVIGVVLAAIFTQHRDHGVHVATRRPKRREPVPQPRFGVMTRRRAWPAA